MMASCRCTKTQFGQRARLHNLAYCSLLFTHLDYLDILESIELKHLLKEYKTPLGNH